MIRILLAMSFLLLSPAAFAQDDDADDKPVKEQKLKERKEADEDDQDKPAPASALKTQMQQDIARIEKLLQGKERVQAEAVFRHAMQVIDKQGRKLDNQIKNTANTNDADMLKEQLISLKEEREELKALSYEMLENGDEILGKLNALMEEM